MSEINSPVAALQSIRRIAGMRILDIGCGTGALARQLIAAGADVTGIDPEASAIHAAANAAPEGRFLIGVAEALPLDDMSVNVAMMVNSLHHVPMESMRLAIHEAVRVLADDGVLLIAEPLTKGTFFEALLPIEDETIVRLAAQAVITEELAAGGIRLIESLTYSRAESFDTVEQFFDRVVAVDPARQRTIEGNRADITAAVLKAARKETGRLILDQPIKIDMIRRA
ncbi:class I SAM-dependent methyltransferase [Rhizobium sp. TH2]|uniref:class I SAM-dependent methyltransferase n=1 Tax=Rhizobium sp. TH2 TaxID=2775403 RepID=UPI0021588E81|nr:class I SAM-dependent methyltransferase [Rhizobium sp. TH2]UVC08041.1 class I SAM-dependent methyltransferase [Rhizobium sp. TH2]